MTVDEDVLKELRARLARARQVGKSILLPFDVYLCHAMDAKVVVLRASAKAIARTVATGKLHTKRVDTPDYVACVDSRTGRARTLKVTGRRGTKRGQQTWTVCPVPDADDIARILTTEQPQEPNAERSDDRA